MDGLVGAMGGGGASWKGGRGRQREAEGGSSTSSVFIQTTYYIGG